ncbi:MAG: porin family protein [Bacteroidota bacterium]
MKTSKLMILGTLLYYSSTVVGQVNNTTINVNGDSTSTQQTDINVTTPAPQTQPVQVVTPPPAPTPAPAPVVVPETSKAEDTEPVFRSGEFGVRFMPTFSKFRLRNAQGGAVEGEFAVGYGYGALLAINSKHVGLQLEVLYNSTSQKYKDAELERQIHVNYLNIPLLLTLNTDKSKPVNLHVAVGPQFGVNVGSRIETTGTSETTVVEPRLAVKKGDFGFAYGAGLEFALNPKRTVRFNFGFRGVYGLVDIRDSSATTTNGEYIVLDRTRTETYSGYVGLSFLF